MAIFSFRSPFRKESVSDYTGVLVPLAQAQRHPDVVAELEKRHATQRSSQSSSENQEAERAVTDAHGPGSTDVSINSDESGNPILQFAIEDLKLEIDKDAAIGGDNSFYDRKSKIVNLAIQDIGMGTYNWQLFGLCGFGWFADNLWIQAIAVTLPSLSAEFSISELKVRYTTCALFVGLCAGAIIWGIGSDILGRRLAFNVTLFIAGLFGLVVGFAKSWIGACGMYSALGFGIGGNLPVDSALFLEFLPSKSSGLLTLLSIWWPVGQTVGSAFAMYFLTGKFPINLGWRYLTFTLGGITLVMSFGRFVVFRLFESPKYLLSRGRQAEAVAVIHGVAYKNKKTTWLTEEILNEVGGIEDAQDTTRLSLLEILRRKFSTFGPKRISPLFRNKRLGFTTGLLWVCWFAIGMGYPLFNSFLPQYLSKGQKEAGTTISAKNTYRSYMIISVMGIPSSILGYYAVNWKFLGRKWTMVISTMLSGLFLILFTLSSNDNFQLAFSCVEAFFQNIMCAVLYSYTPEVFPAPNRGTGSGIASMLSRIGGLCAPIIAANIPDANPSIPVYLSGGLLLVAFLAMVCLPIETRGKQTL